MISLKAQGIKALIPSALVSEGPRSKGLMAAILLCQRELEWNWCGSLALSFETNEFRIKEGGRDRESSLLPGKRKWAKSPAREEALRESI